MHIFSNLRVGRKSLGGRVGLKKHAAGEGVG